LLRAIVTALAAPSFCVALPASAADDPPLRNWFDDPFIEVTTEGPACPLPRGPWMTEAEQKREAHGRIERGTSCWLAGDCKEPNAYRYDKPIAEAVAQRFADPGARRAFAGTHVWITVQRRFVYLEGCVRDAAQAVALEALARQVPEVQYAVANVRVGTAGWVPYAVRP
jgi:hypothetical protein